MLFSFSLHFKSLPTSLKKAGPGGAVVKNSPANAGDTGDMGLIPGSGRFPRVGNGNPLVFLPGKFDGQEPDRLQSIGLQRV